MSRGIALLFVGTRHSRWGWGVSPTPRPPLSPRKTRYLLYKRLGEPQGRSGRAENLVPTGIWSRTVQPVVSRYTEWATRPTVSWYSLVDIHPWYLRGETVGNRWNPSRCPVRNWNQGISHVNQDRYPCITLLDSEFWEAISRQHISKLPASFVTRNSYRVCKSLQLDSVMSPGPQPHIFFL